MDDDCYIPWNKRAVTKIAVSAKLTASSGEPENLRNGWNRQIGGDSNSWSGKAGDSIEYNFKQPEKLKEVRIVFDSNLNRIDPEINQDAKNMRNFYTLNAPKWKMPETLVKEFSVEVELSSGEKKVIFETDNNYQRLVKIDLEESDVKVLRLIPKNTWGAEEINIFEFDVK